MVIALAARSQSPAQPEKAIMIGSAAAIIMRIVLMLPWLKFIGALLLVYIGVTLLLPEAQLCPYGRGAGCGAGD